MKNNKIAEKSRRNIWKSVRLFLFILLGLFIYAYGFEVTKVDLDDFRQESRQVSRIRVIRNLVQPDIFTHDYNESYLNIPFHLPCPEEDNGESATFSLNEMSISLPVCADLGAEIAIQGDNLPKRSSGYIYFIPGIDPESTVALHKGTFTADGSGQFNVTIELPTDRASADEQFIRIRVREQVGSPHFSENAIATWEKIIETVFMALIATTIGTLLAIPISFFAARNLMKNVKNNLTSISMSLLGWPVGGVIGYWITSQTGSLSHQYLYDWWINLILSILIPMIFILIIRWSLPQVEINPPGKLIRFLRRIMLGLAILLGILGTFQIANLMVISGKAASGVFESLSFLGYFIDKSGDILGTVLPVVGGVIGGGFLSSYLGRIGQNASEKLPDKMIRTINIATSGAAGAMLFGLTGLAIKWLYEINDFRTTLLVPVIIGGLAGVILGIATPPKRVMPIGLAIYYLTRTILNAVRSIEALVMAIVFVIWVGIGPFAGMLALALHTVVSLAKLYSEQVESIQPGPLEAVSATGANRLQTIIYAVVPQIVPPYISYTMYRWDINVRMSTIIGFVGGGGIGFLLQQNINLLNYNAASTQMIAIAVVVASMDYISSVLREKTI